MQNIVANVDNTKFDMEVAIEMQNGTLPLPFHGMDKSSSAVCQFYKHHSCVKGALCPFRHVKGEKAVVCKHWLRGLCKKGDECEFLHQFDMQKMPECFFFAKFGMCSNKDCPFLHIDPDSKMKDCPWYDRGFCKHGPHCKNRHVRRILCPNYLNGFCIDGPNCKFMHPNFDLPVVSDLKDSNTKKLTCHSCGEPGHKAAHCTKYPTSYQHQNYQGSSHSQASNYNYKQNSHTQGIKVLGKSDTNAQNHSNPQATGNGETGHQNQQGYQRRGPRGTRSLDTVTCFKCGEKGHYANHCPKGHLAFLSNALDNTQNQQPQT